MWLRIKLLIPASSTNLWKLYYIPLWIILKYFFTIKYILTIVIDVTYILWYNNAAQRNAARCDTMQCNAATQRNPTQRNAMERNGTERNEMQCNAMQCNTLSFYETEQE